MPKQCGVCHRDLPKGEFRGTGSAKKKKGKKTCKECVEAGGNCVTLSPAGFRLSGCPYDDTSFHHNLNGVYAKTSRMESGRFVYEHIQFGEVCAWHYKDEWKFGYEQEVGSDACVVRTHHHAATPSGVTDGQWDVLMNEGYLTFSEVTTTALSAVELEIAQALVARRLSESLEQAAPAFVLSGLPADHALAGMMGEYVRQDNAGKEYGRFCYQGSSLPQGAQFTINSWTFTDGGHGFAAHSHAAAPEQIKIRHWHMVKDNEWLSFEELTVTPVHHKPTSTFTGTCAECDHCGEWRRCGQCRSTGGWYCSEECQQTAKKAAGCQESA